MQQAALCRTRPTEEKLWQYKPFLNSLKKPLLLYQERLFSSAYMFITPKWNFVLGRTRRVKPNRSKSAERKWAFSTTALLATRFASFTHSSVSWLLFAAPRTGEKLDASFISSVNMGSM